jgi:hypothetical protein
VTIPAYKFVFRFAKSESRIEYHFDIRPERESVYEFVDLRLPDSSRVKGRSWKVPEERAHVVGAAAKSGKDSTPSFVDLGERSFAIIGDVNESSWLGHLDDRLQCGNDRCVIVFGEVTAGVPGSFIAKGSREKLRKINEENIAWRQAGIAFLGREVGLLEDTAISLPKRLEQALHSHSALPL